MPLDENSAAEAELLLTWATQHGGNNALLARLVVAIDNLESAIREQQQP